MSQYVKARILLTEANNSSFYNSLGFDANYSDTVEESIHLTVSAAITTGTDLDLSGIVADADSVFIENTDSDNKVTVTLDTNTTATMSFDIPAGKFVLLTDFDPATAINITATTAACLCEVYAW